MWGGEESWLAHGLTPLILGNGKAFLKVAGRYTRNLVLPEWLKDRGLCALPQRGWTLLNQGPNVAPTLTPLLRDGGLWETLCVSSPLKRSSDLSLDGQSTAFQNFPWL